MQTINDRIPASGALPENYQEVLSWKVTGKPMRLIALNIVGANLFILFGMIFFSLAIRLGKMPSEGNFRLGLGEMVLAIVGIVVTFIFHELTHGLAMQMFGASPKYGIIWKGLMLYATSPGYAYRRNNYVVIVLAPLFSSVCWSFWECWYCRGQPGWFYWQSAGLSTPAAPWVIYGS